jgi:TonB family protein
VHFLWQGALLALAAAVVMRWAAPTARARYIAGVATLALMMAVPVGTFAVIATTEPVHAAASGQPEATGLASARTEATADDARARPSTSSADRLLPAVVLLWVSGVLLLSARLLGGWAVVRQLAAQTTEPVAADVAALAVRVAGRLGLRRLVRIAESSSITVPIVIGWFRPVVLVPTAAVAGLAPAHLEALLAHELAHVRRHDYLINLLQSAVETLLFYHPAVWWVSRRVRQEREHCCDDDAVAICDRMVYVRALADLAAMTVQPRFALAATDGSLLRRVRRLLSSAPEQRPSAGWLSATVVILLTAALAPAALALGGKAQTPAPLLPTLAATSAPPSTSDVRARAVAVSGAQIPAPSASLGQSVPAPSRHRETTGRQQPRPAHSTQANAESTDPAIQRTLDERTGSGAARIRETASVPAERTGTAGATTPQQRVFTIGGDLKEPRLVTRVEPAYPAEAKAEGAQGPVYVEAIIGRDGRVRDAKPVGGHPSASLRQAAMGAVQQWVYSPTYLNGDPIEVQLSVQVVFRLTPATQLATARQQLVEARARYSPDHPDVRRLERQVQQLELTVAGQQQPAFPLDDPAAQVRAGDLLVVNIAGEDQLPKWYVVETDGTIRLPLIRRLSVTDRTAVQAADVIRQALARHNVGESARAVTVVIHRRK